MPVYFGHDITRRGEKKVDVSDSLKKVGIELLRAAPSQVVVTVLPFVTSPVWSMFIASLSALLLSLSVGTPISLNLAGYRIDHRHPSRFPYTLPRISIEVTNKGPKQLEWLMENGFEEQEIRGKAYFICEEPSHDSLRSLLDGSSSVDYNDRNYVPLRTANISSLLVVSEMVNTLSYLLQVLQMRLFDELPQRSDIMGPEDEVGELIESMQVDSADKPVPTSRKQVSSGLSELGKLFSHFSDFLKGPSKSDMVTATTLSPLRTFVSLDVALTHTEHVSGTFLRYVPDLSEDDPTGVIQFFSRYLRRSLGLTTTEICERLDDYRASWGILKSTEVGHILSHLVKCMEIAIEAHCGLTAIFDSEVYEGCVLKGSGYSLNFRNSNFLPLSPVELNDELDTVETNRRLLKKLYDLVDSAVESFKGTDLTNPTKLRSLLLVCSFTDSEKTTVLDLVGRIRFTQKKWPVTLTNIMRFLDILSKSLDDIDFETPLGPEAMFSTDPIEVAMSCFKDGSFPSFRHPSGVPIDLSLRKAPGPQLSNQSKKGKGPQSVNNGGWIFSVRRVDFVEAVSDFRLLLKEKEARSLGSAASKGLGYFVLAGGNFERVFLKLRDVIGTIDPSSVANPEVDNELGSKRRLEDTLDDGVVRQKRKVML